MLDSVLRRWILAFATAVIVGLLVTALISRGARKADVSDHEAVAAWKARIGVDLESLPRIHPPHPDSDEALALDALLQPVDLQLSMRRRADGRSAPREADMEDFNALREAMRDAMRTEKVGTGALPPAVAAAIDRRAATLEAVADYVATHGQIRWSEDFRTHPRIVRFRLMDHLTLHRLLLGRAMVALGRGDNALAGRMLETSRRLNGVLEARQDLASHTVATGIERMQLALLRHARGTLGTTTRSPGEGIQERYRNAMSNEAAVALTMARTDTISLEDGDPALAAVRVVAGPKLQAAVADAVKGAALAASRILAAEDGCAELAKKLPRPEGFLDDEYSTLDAKDAWRRFVLLELDRAMTSAVLTGTASSPCRSVTITVTEQGSARTVKATGFPAESESVIAVPAVMTMRLDGEPRATASARSVR